MDCPFHLSIPLFPEPLHVSRAQGRERLSAAYRFDVVVFAEGAEDAAALLDQPARLTLLSGAALMRTVHGVVARVVELGRALRERRSLRLSIVPRAHRARLGRRRRVFQDMTALEIVTAALAPHQAAVRSLVARPLSRRAYCLQYDESDWDFARRLLAEEGLFFSFEHDEALPAEVMVIGDTPLDQRPISGDPHLVFRRAAEGSALAAEEDHVTHFVFRERLGTLATHVHGYDFNRPDVLLESRAPAPVAAPGERTVSEHEHPYESDVIPFPAAVRLEQAQRRTARARGESMCKRLLPGRRFTLSGHEAPGLDREWAVTTVEHEAYSSEAAPAGGSLYQCRFEAIPANRVLRPRWTGTRPRQVAETAVVVGPPGHEIHTDPSGRIKVQFHWDGEGQNDERSSCWVRVTQTWAGAGWGFQFIPRIGMEVVVTFLGGDVDRPLVTGCVVNATHPPPFPLPQMATRSGVRTRSTPAATGANELSFEDASGAEEVYLHAQRDYREVVLHNRTSRIDGDASKSTAGHAHERVGKTSQLEVAGDRKVTVGGDERLHVQGIAEARTDGDSTVVVGGSSSTTVRGTASTEVLGDLTLVVGGPETPAQSDQYVYGGASLSVAERLVLQADKTLVLQCGKSLIELSPDKIVLRSKTVEISPEDALELSTKDGPAVTLGEDVEILSKKFRVFTDSGALEIDKDFKAKGASIKLGYDPSKPSKEKAEEEAKTKKFSCKLSDYFLKPFTNKKYHLLAGGLRFEGTTDGEGTVTAEIPEDVKQVSVRLWIDDYPQGRQRLYTLKLSEEKPPEGVPGAKLRLRNLGYYEGGLDVTENAKFQAALAEFQQDHRDSHGLEATGQLDEGTAGALEEIHGY